MGKVRDAVGLPGLDEGEEAFERVYPVLRAGLVRWLGRQGRRRALGFGMALQEFRELLEEVADETLCLTRRRLAEYDPARGPFAWWLAMLGRSVLKRELMIWVRWQKRTREAQVAWGAEAPEDPGARDLRAAVDRERLGRALAALPPEQARALALFYLMDLSAEEVGRALGRTPEAVSSLLQRARANALEALQGREVRRRGRPRKGGKA